MGSPFIGTLGCGGMGTYSNDNGTFTISGNALIVNQSISADTNTIQNVTIVAAQSRGNRKCNALFSACLYFARGF